MSAEVPSAGRPGAARRRSTARRLLRDPQAVGAASVLLLIVALGLLAPVLASHGPNEASLDHIDAGVGTPGYPLGGDRSGRDVWSRLLHSINTSAVSALIGASIALVIGVAGGLVGGYYDRVRSVTEWLFSLVMTFPGILLLIVLMPLTGGDFRATMAIFGVLLSPGIYRLVRNQVVGVRGELFVDAARVSGLTDRRILARHVLSAVRGPVIIAAAFLCGSSIGVQSGLAFLGVGSAEVPSFGAMISEGFQNLYISPLQVVWPSLVLGLTTSCLVLFGNALRDALEGAGRRRAGASLHRADTAAVREDAPTDGLRTDGARTDGPRTEGAGTEGAPSALLTIEDLVIAYASPSGEPKEVVRGVNLRLAAGETLGLVGESGSGKTQTAFAALGVLPPEAAVARGSIRLDGRELLGLKEADLRRLRGRSIAYVPQEPMANLDPSFTVGAQLVEGLRATTDLSRGDARDRVLALLKRVGIPDPPRTFGSYPHQLSGGMAQRVLIAGAVAGRPLVLIADEPTTALDVTVQAEILDLLRDLRKELNMAVLLVTHDFGVVADVCDRVAVMREGEIVETGTTEQVFGAPAHDHTRLLLDSILDERTVREDAPATLGKAGS